MPSLGKRLRGTLGVNLAKQASAGKPTDRSLKAAEGWLVGGGEMAKVIAAMDWTESSLGPIESWPQSLRTMVSLAQASNSPMSLSWGAGHVQIYNDGYWPICGTKHPGSMGQDFRECWASAFPVIGEAYVSAWSGKSAYLEKMRMFLDRYGFLEETWFTFSFSPVTDESGGIGGVFHPVTEMTSQMLSERRTRTARDLASRAAKARTSEQAFFICTEVLAEANLDLPFFLLYVVDGVSGLATLVGRTGLRRDIVPTTVDTRSDTNAEWAIAEVARTGVAKQLDDVRMYLADAEVGPYPEQPNTALVLPLMLPGSDVPAAVMVAGVSARLHLQESYRAFYDLLAAGVTTALASARAYEEEREKSDALARLDAAKNAFFSNVSHEFRTPLTLILGPIEQALMQGNLAGEDLKTVHRNALRLLRLVNNLLDFSRIEAGRLQSSFEPSDLSALTSALAHSFESLITSTGVRLSVSCAALPELVYIDHSQWEKIVLNLVSNAFKFTLNGEISVRLRAVDGHAELSVTDTGSGIPALELPLIFDRFHRVEGSRGRGIEGTGIGLALVSELVKAHGGTLRVESVVGQGSTFVAAIPFGFAHLPPERVRFEQSTHAAQHDVSPYALDAGARAVTQGTKPAELALSPRAERILIADDNADMREYIGRLLNPYWHVELVNDGREAFDSALARPPDLILSDVMMPGMDGVALVKALREDTRTAAIPVVLLSARAGEEAVLEGLDTLADDYMVKPFSARELVTRVRTHLRMAGLRQRLRAQLVTADRMAAVGMLAAGVAHEINNPLSYVTSNLDLIAEGLRPPLPDSVSTLASSLDVMVNEARLGAERVANIVRGMSTFSRADEERRATFAVQPLLELSIDMAFSQIKQRARIVKEFGAAPLIEADEARLGQVFVNLLVNAGHAIAEGDPEKNQVRVLTRTDTSGRCVIEVRDTGRGIAPDVLNRIFDPFFTTKAIGDGLGLGLSICHGIVQALGGEITAESELGIGSTFRIVLPAATGEIREQESPVLTARALAVRRGRVLIIDDDAMVGAMLNRILAKEHDVTVMTDGRHALDLLLAGDKFDVVLCDLTMPITTGMDIYNTLQSALPDVLQRVVFVTGGAVTAAGRKFLEMVPNQRVQKPFTANGMRALVRGFVVE